MNITDWHEYPTNYSNGTSVDGIGTLFQYVNLVSGGWMGTGIVLMIWLAVFGVSLVSGSGKAILTASFIAFVFATWFATLGMLNPIVLFVLLILIIISAVFGRGESSQL